MLLSMRRIVFERINIFESFFKMSHIMCLKLVSKVSTANVNFRLFSHIFMMMLIKVDVVQQ